MSDTTNISATSSERLSGSAIGSAPFFEAVDINGDGFIEEAEFLQMLRLSEDLFDSDYGASPSWDNIEKTNTEKISTEEFASWWEMATHHKLHDDGTFADEGHANRLKALLGKLTLTGTAVKESATRDEEAPAFNEKLIASFDENIALLDQKIDAKFTLSANKHILLPEDTFSFFAFVDVRSPSFLVALLVFSIQVTTLSLLMADIIDLKDEQNPLGIPASVELPVRASQLLALFIAVISQTDVVSSANLLYKVFKSKDLNEALTLTAGSGRIKWFGSVFARFLEGCFGLTVTFILIMRADTVRYVLLNFTAVEFVSSIDNVVFYLAKLNYLGRKIKQDAENPVIERDSRFGLHFVLLSLIFLAFFGGWFGIVAKQNKGDYLPQMVLVQFDDEFSPALGSFSGIYDIGKAGDIFSVSRVEYVERRSSKAWLRYCGEDGGFWTLSKERDDPCSWLARSSESTSLDILDTLSSRWFAKDTNADKEVPMQHVELSAYGGGDKNECGGHGSFLDEKCECEGGWFGLKCEFPEPCESLAVDIRRNGFLSGSREWSTSYDIFRTKSGDLVKVYDHPVFFNDKINPGRFEIIMFTGRRWVLFEPVEGTRAGLEEYLGDFHAYFTRFNASFISEPMDVGTPKDALTPVGLEWFLSSPRTNRASSQDGIQSVDSTRASDAILLCGVCNNATNVCQNNGRCEIDTCICDIGSTGSLCENPPIGNGQCDSFFNDPQFNLDGGDCCEATCVSSSEYFCGKDDTGYRDIGYPSCRLPVKLWAPSSLPIPGSRSLARSGSSVALSGNGAMLAIGEPSLDAVRLLSKDGSQWIEQELLEGPPGSRFGFSVVMSGGSTNAVNNPSGRAPVTIAIASNEMVRVYDCTRLRCIQVGDLLDLPFGTALAMSGNGEFVAVGSVSIYRAANLGVRGGNITPEENVYIFGYALSLSGDGGTLAIGSTSTSGSFLVQMYKWDKTISSAFDDKWDETSYVFDGNEIELTARGALVQGAVALSNDAMVLAISFTFDVDLPAVKVYQWTETDLKWTKRADITNSGGSIDLSFDGSIISVGTSEVGGSVRTYKWNNTDYEQLWNDVPGGEETALALSDNGSVLAVGLPTSEFNRGETTVYSFLSDLCGEGNNRFRLSLTFDDKPWQTYWNLMSSSSREIVMEGESYHDFKYAGTTLVEETCLEKDECFIFTIFDSNNGITPPGGYNIYLNGEERHKGGDLLRKETVDIGNCTCSEGSSRVRIAIGTWHAIENMSWEIVDNGSEEILLRGGDYTGDEKNYFFNMEDACVPTEGCLSLIFFYKNANFYGGVAYLPEYTLYLDGEVMKEGGGRDDIDFSAGSDYTSDHSETFRFGNMTADCGPTSSPTSPPS